MNAGAVEERSRRARPCCQFRLVDLLAVVTLCAAALSVLASRRSGSAITFLALVVFFFTTILLARGLLFRGSRPIVASLLAGGVLGLLLWGWAVWDFQTSIFVRRNVWPSTGAIVADAVLDVLVGALAGALTAVLIAGIFAALHHKTRRIAIVTAVTMLAIAILVQRPLRIAWHYYKMETSLSYARRESQPWPTRCLLIRLRAVWGSSYYINWRGHYGYHRDKLVDLGYLAHRDFVFEQNALAEAARRTRFSQSNVLAHCVQQAFPGYRHASVGSAECVQQALPGNQHVRVWTIDRGAGAVLHVWDRPERMPQWEAFVHELCAPR